jgi:hypothetical protein
MGQGRAGAKDTRRTDALANVVLATLRWQYPKFILFFSLKHYLGNLRTFRGP